MRRFCASVVGVGALIGVCGSASASLVTNGGFETGDFSGWGTQAAGAGSSFGITSGGHTGSFAMFFQATGGQHDAIFQNLATTMGLEYTVSFWVNNGGVGDDSLQVLWEGATVLDQTPVGTELENWVNISFNVTANSNGSELRLRGFDGPAYFLLDDISVKEVPTPGALALLGVGGAAMVTRRRVR